MSAEQHEPPKSLRCASFHSVKGGVGKSTLSYLAARRLAEYGPVALIDADLTGTSLADVLDLRAPRWNGLEPSERLPLDRQPDDWHPVDRRRVNLDARANESDGHCRVVPLLNDFLLWTKDRYNPEDDVHPEALFWKLPAADPLAKRLFVVPSSALPNDLSQILPLIYDELHAAYLESRLEWLLHWILERTPVRRVVFDTPPTIPGLSRAVLSMAMRLPKYEPLADDEGTPLALTREHATRISWAPFLVVSTDMQDLRAADRWLDGRPQDELSQICVVLNRANGQWEDIGEKLKQRLSAVESSDAREAEVGVPHLYGGRLLGTPSVVLDRDELRIFKGDALSPAGSAELDSLIEKIEG